MEPETLEKCSKKRCRHESSLNVWMWPEGDGQRQLEKQHVHFLRRKDNFFYWTHWSICEICIYRIKEKRAVSSISTTHKHMQVPGRRSVSHIFHSLSVWALNSRPWDEFLRPAYSKANTLPRTHSRRAVGFSRVSPACMRRWLQRPGVTRRRRD